MNGPNPGEKIELRAKYSGSCIEGELVLTELAWLFRSEFVLFFQKGVTSVRHLPMTFVSFALFQVSSLVWKQSERFDKLVFCYNFD